MIRIAVPAAVAVLALAGCSSSDGTATPGPATTTTTKAGASAPVSTPPTTPAVDPYDVYLKNAPKGEKTLSREDAALRARLGCGKTYAPGTVDAVLATAYRDYCK